MVLEQRAPARVSPTVFRRCFFLGMLALGAHLLFKAVIRGEPVYSDMIVDMSNIW